MAALLETALAYHSKGLCVLPARRIMKCPALKEWKSFQSLLPTEHEARAWFSNPQDALCLICGEVSGNLGALDFDLAGAVYEEWAKRIEERVPGLLERLVIERTPAKGRHVIFRCEVIVGNSTKLAQRRIVVDEADVREVVKNGTTIYEASIEGKDYVVRRDADGQWQVVVTLIETKGEGGLFLCAPTQGYELIQGDFTNLPVITAEEREILIQTARELNEHFPEVISGPRPTIPSVGHGERPGDEFNQVGDIRPILEKHGWVQIGGGKNEHWRRPGKEHGTSATLKDGVFYVFTSNAPPFEPSQAYSPFSVYTLLEHNGDYTAAACALRNEGFGNLEPLHNEVDISGILDQLESQKETGFEEREKDVEELMELYPKLRTPVIHGLLRQGETMNVVSAPKIGKSWLVNHLAISVATGGQWLGFDCEQSDVLVIDNELHPESCIYRLVKVANALGINIREIKNKIRFRNLRGKLRDLISLGPYLQSIPPGKYKVIILDAFYRFLPQGMDENDNGTMATLYNYIDSYADHLQCCFVIIHHTSKGNQSMKDITDVGAGAGSQSRATDAHVVLRRHEEEDVVSLDAVARSWPPPESRCLRWSFPIWMPAEDLDPKDLRRDVPRKTEKQVRDAVDQTWSTDDFINRFVGEEPKSKARILEEAEAEGLSLYRVNHFLNLAQEAEQIFRWSIGTNKVLGFATAQQPRPKRTLKSKAAIARAAIESNPKLTSKELCDQFGITRQYANRLLNEIK